MTVYGAWEYRVMVRRDFVCLVSWVLDPSQSIQTPGRTVEVY